MHSDHRVAFIVYKIQIHTYKYMPTSLFYNNMMISDYTLVMRKRIEGINYLHQVIITKVSFNICFILNPIIRESPDFKSSFLSSKTLISLSTCFSHFSLDLHYFCIKNSIEN